MPRSSRSRESGSRRSRSSSGRSRSRHRDHHHHRHGDQSANAHLRQLYRFRHKQKEQNFKAASCSMIAIVTLCTALSEPRWISLHGGGCTIGDKETTTSTGLDHLGAYQFFYPGKFLAVNTDVTDGTLYQYGPSSTAYMHNCVTHKAVVLMKAVISCTFIAMVCTLAAFLLDLIGPSRWALLKILRRNAILNIIAVIMCVMINMFCYWLTAEVQALQKSTKMHPGSKVNVKFDISFFLIAAAGAVGVLATALNCLRRYPSYDDSPSEALLDDFDGMEGLLAPGPDSAAMANIPPPPAYTP